MVVFSNVTKRYPGGITALDTVSMEIQEGDFLFITGPSGAGKTTMIRLLLAMERPTEGSILVARRNIAALTDSAIPFLRRNIGVVFQDFRLIDTRTVYENIAITLEVLGLHPRDTRARVNQVLEALELGHLARAYPTMLSGGEQQRVAIARAVVNDPPLIIADEPTGNLDPALSIEVMDLLMESHRKGATVMVATHDRELMNRYRSRCIQLYKGRKVGEVLTGESGGKDD
jgi:cell division transport system ATP-binding protein